MTSAIEQASNLFFDLLGNASTHFGALYTSSDNYHDLEFYLGNSKEHKISLFITVETDTLPGDGRTHFDGTCRLVGRPIESMDDDEFNTGFGFDFAGIYTLSALPRRSVNFEAFNEGLFKEHFSALVDPTKKADPQQLIQRLIDHQKAHLSTIAHTAGVPLVWK